MCVPCSAQRDVCHVVLGGMWMSMRNDGCVPCSAERDGMCPMGRYAPREDVCHPVLRRMWMSMRDVSHEKTIRMWMDVSHEKTRRMWMCHEACVP